MFWEIFFFPLKNLSQGNFLYYPRFFTPSKNLNTACISTEIKETLLNGISSRKDFHLFCEIVKHQSRLDEYNLFRKIN